MPTTFYPFQRWIDEESTGNWYDEGLLDDLKALWKLNENTGIAFDSFGSNHLSETSGTIPSTAGLFGDARDFELGDTEYLTIADNPILSGSDRVMMFAAWCKPESTGSDIVVFGKGNFTAATHEYAVYLNGGTFRTAWSDGSALKTLDWSSSASVGTWYLVIVWHDPVANTINMQVNNGTPVSTAHSTGVTNTSQAFSIGASGAGILPWDGLIQQVVYWDRILTSDQRTALWNSGAGLPYDHVKNRTKAFGGWWDAQVSIDLVSDLEAWWQLYDTSDSTGNGYILTDQGLAYTTGIHGNAAINEAGSNESGLYIGYADLNNLLDICALAPFSFTMWLYTETGHSSTGTLLQLGDNNGFATINLFTADFLGGNKIFLEMSDEFASPGLISVDYTDDEWVHIAVTFDGSVGRLYFNGFEAASTLNMTSLYTVDSSGRFTLMRTRFDGSPLDGALDEVGFWLRALTADEVTALHSEEYFPYEEVTAIEGDISITLPFLNQSASGKSVVTGAASQTLTFLNQSLSGKSIVQGAASQTLTFLNQSLSGLSVVQGDIDQTLPFITQSLSGSDEANGDISITLPFLTQSLSGLSVVNGTCSQTLAFLNQTLSGKSVVSGAASQTLVFLNQSLSGKSVVQGSIAQTLIFLNQTLIGSARLAELKYTSGYIDLGSYGGQQNVETVGATQNLATFGGRISGL